MKNLELNKMENLEGGRWSWKQCAGGAGGAAATYVYSPWIVFGYWGLAAAAGAGCVLGGIN